MIKSSMEYIKKIMKKWSEHFNKESEIKIEIDFSIGNSDKPKPVGIEQSPRKI